MAKIKLNNGDNYEHLCNVHLTEEKFPKVYAAKLDELVNRSGMTKDEAKAFLRSVPIELELYYSPDCGCFAVETEAVDNGAIIFDPYTGEECEPADED
jgi:hypothetical protein